MPVSEDLKSVHVALAAVARSVAADKEPVIRLACANILSLAEQVEALENMPMGMPGERLFGLGALMQDAPPALQ